MRWPETPRGWLQCQFCRGLRWLGIDHEAETRVHVATWVFEERRAYADVKWSAEGAPDAHRDAVLGRGPTRIVDWIGNYLKRAEMFGLDSPQGRQALGKAVVTTLHALETAVGEYGPMPAPGVPSGDVTHPLTP